MEENVITGKIIAAAIEVHKHLGPGLLESAYQTCLAHELHLMGLAFEKEKSLPVEYKGIKLDCGYRLDLVVENLVIIEIKAVDKLLPIHKAQVMTYLKLTGLRLGLLLNFNTPIIKDGIKRIIVGLEEPPNNMETTSEDN
jgi:GxxExxY protein